MEAFGYDKRDEEFDEILKLSQVTLSCKKCELDSIIALLNRVKKDSKDANIEYDAHWHYRDFNDSWKEKESDLIIYLEK